MNFTYTVIPPIDGQYGSIKPDGTWTGKVGMLTRHEVDMGI